mgnify:FL=1
MNSLEFSLNYKLKILWFWSSFGENMIQKRYILFSDIHYATILSYVTLWRPRPIKTAINIFQINNLINPNKNISVRPMFSRNYQF